MFQSTHPHGVRQKKKISTKILCCFNPRTRMGCDEILRRARGYPCSFNPRTRMGCDKAMSRCTTLLWSFNPRTRMGCDPVTDAALLSVRSFNPRTRMGCDLQDFMTIFKKQVSIHAPAWGATCARRRTAALMRSFNPRTRMGCDVPVIQVGNSSLVSIHAPAWGATPQKSNALHHQEFQSTHPHGVRRTQFLVPKDVLQSFNPRTRMGCDVKRFKSEGIDGLFQSTHPHGVRPYTQQ